MNLGFEMLADLDVPRKTIRVGRSNLFLSPAFREIFCNVTATTLELYDTDGAAGAARGAALGHGFYTNPEEAFAGLEKLEVIEPETDKVARYNELFQEWKKGVQQFIHNSEAE